MPSLQELAAIERFEELQRELEALSSFSRVLSRIGSFVSSGPEYVQLSLLDEDEV